MGETFNQESAFNEAILKMQRIHTAQEIINQLRTNMLAFNPGYNKYNYEIIVSNLISLCYEVSPLMKPVELKAFHDYRKLLDDMFLLKPVFEVPAVSNFNDAKPQQKVNNDNWNKLRELMFVVEDFARKQIDIHGLASPKKKDARLASIDL